jgi:hypothetical protein
LVYSYDNRVDELPDEQYPDQKPRGNEFMDNQQHTHITEPTVERIRQAGTDRMRARGASQLSHQAKARRRVYTEYALNALAVIGLCAAFYILFFFAWFMTG